jgi:hypothetical protein
MIGTRLMAEAVRSLADGRRFCHGSICGVAKPGNAFPAVILCRELVALKTAQHRGAIIAQDAMP